MGESKGKRWSLCPRIHACEEIPNWSNMSIRMVVLKRERDHGGSV